MIGKRYQIAIAASAFVAVVLLLAGKPLSLSAGRPVEAGQATVGSLGSIPGDLSEPEVPDDVAAYRQAIEDVLPLMRSLRVRGDTVRLAQLARSVIQVWAELESVDPEAVPDDALRDLIEGWANSSRVTYPQPEPADRLGR